MDVYPSTTARQVSEEMLVLNTLEQKTWRTSADTEGPRSWNPLTRTTGDLKGFVGTQTVADSEEAFQTPVKDGGSSPKDIVSLKNEVEWV